MNPRSEKIVITQQQYKNSNGTICPACGTEDRITCGEMDFEGMCRDVACQCGATWKETFAITGYTDLDKSEMKTV